MFRANPIGNEAAGASFTQVQPVQASTYLLVEKSNLRAVENDGFYLHFKSGHDDRLAQEIVVVATPRTHI